MAITETPVRFETSDGREWDTKEEAERHEELTTRRRAYEEARRAFGRALARTQRTADGEPFDFGVFRGYFHVRRAYGQLPTLEQVDFYRWDFDFREYDDSLRLFTGEGDRRRWFAVGELYRHQVNAERALLTAQEEWLAEKQAEVEELRARLGPGSVST